MFGSRAGSPSFLLRSAALCPLAQKANVPARRASAVKCKKAVVPCMAHELPVAGAWWSRNAAKFQLYTTAKAIGKEAKNEEEQAKAVQSWTPDPILSESWAAGPKASSATFVATLLKKGFAEATAMVSAMLMLLSVGNKGVIQPTVKYLVEICSLPRTVTRTDTSVASLVGLSVDIVKTVKKQEDMSKKQEDTSKTQEDMRKPQDDMSKTVREILEAIKDPKRKR
ncbi:hypothetical protein WJX72_006693 [[Myrmecia] bisecta]|uniref:Uncharacterized protein n=1 Tax=[Myrmecia] bisecta TaxID=41462 RepID=A0AAW1QR85_9CHLO